MDDTDRRVLRTALDTTRAGRAVWEVFPENQKIRALFDAYVLRITPESPGYELVVHETFIRPAEEYTIVPDATDFPLVDELYRAGRAVARDTDIVMAERFQRLKQR